MIRRQLYILILDCIVLAITAALLCVVAYGQEIGNEITLPSKAPEGCCVVTAQNPEVRGEWFRGTATLIAKDGERGTVLTCWHVFRGATPPYEVRFPDGSRFGALLTAVDPQWEFAILKIRTPAAEPVPVNLDTPYNEQLWAGGFGDHRDRWRHTTGFRSRGFGTKWCTMSGEVRGGDSGGPVLNDKGELVGVVWGTADHEVFFGGGEPLRRFLDASWPSRPAVIVPHASRASVYQTMPTGRPALPGNFPVTSRDEWQKQYGQAAAPQQQRPSTFVDVPPARAQQPIVSADNPATKPLPPYTPPAVVATPSPQKSEDPGKSQQAPVLAQPPAAAPQTVSSPPPVASSPPPATATTAQDLGWPPTITGREQQNIPAGGREAAGAAARWGITALLLYFGVPVSASGAVTYGVYWLGKRAGRCANRLGKQSTSEANSAGTATAPAAEQTFRYAEQTTTHEPIARDPSESVQLLQLAELEGRDPLLDSAAGRVALPRLEVIAESDPDPKKREWARELIYLFTAEFNKLAPAKTTIPS